VESFPPEKVGRTPGVSDGARGRDAGPEVDLLDLILSVRPIAILPGEVQLVEAIANLHHGHIETAQLPFELVAPLGFCIGEPVIAGNQPSTDGRPSNQQKNGKPAEEDPLLNEHGLTTPFVFFASSWAR
jgi:hypothetical protein